MNVTVIRRVLWVAAAGALGGATIAFWNWWPVELVIASGMFVILIPVDMLLAREERERRLPPHGPVRKWGYHDDRPRLAIVRTRPVPWWRRMYDRLTPWWVAAWMPLLLIPTALYLMPTVVI